MKSMNIIEYAFHEKPTTSNRTLQSDTALNQNCLIKSLANEVDRRLDSFSETVDVGERKSCSRQVQKEADQQWSQPNHCKKHTGE